MGGRGSKGKNKSGGGDTPLDFKQNGKYIALGNGDEIKDFSPARTAGYNTQQLPKSPGTTLHFTKDFDVTSYNGNKYTVTKEVTMTSGRFMSKTTGVKKKR